MRRAMVLVAVLALSACTVPRYPPTPTPTPAKPSATASAGRPVVLTNIPSCSDPRRPEYRLPCVVLPGEDGNESGAVYLYTGRPCPSFLPTNIICIDTTGPDYDE